MDDPDVRSWNREERRGVGGKYLHQQMFPTTRTRSTSRLISVVVMAAFQEMKWN